MSGFEDTGGKPLPRLQPDARDAGAKQRAAPVSGAPDKPAPRSAEKSASRRKTAEPSHAGHRQRLRARFIEGGPDALPDYELLEMVLFRAIPRRDTKPLAKALIAHFGRRFTQKKRGRYATWAMLKRSKHWQGTSPTRLGWNGALMRHWL